jgi:DNA repair exonuclease SbcCD ATPase subunit
MDYRTFINSVLFGQRMARMVESKDADKRKLLETMFEMEWIEEARKKASVKVSELEGEIGVLVRDKQHKEDTQLTLTEDINEHNQLLKNLNEEKETLIKAYKEAIEEIQKTIATDELYLHDYKLQSSHDKFKDLAVRYNEAVKEDSQIEAAIDILSTQTTELEDEITDLYEKITEAEKAKPVEIVDYASEIKLRKLEIKSLAFEINSLNEVGKEDVEQWRKSYDDIIGVIKSYNDENTLILKDIEQYKQRYEDLEERLSELSASDDKCPVCSSQLDRNHAEHKKILQDLRLKIKVVEEEMSEIITKLDAAYDRQKAIAEDKKTLEAKAESVNQKLENGSTYLLLSDKIDDVRALVESLTIKNRNQELESLNADGKIISESTLAIANFEKKIVQNNKEIEKKNDELNQISGSIQALDILREEYNLIIANIDAVEDVIKENKANNERNQAEIKRIEESKPSVVDIEPKKLKLKETEEALKEIDIKLDTTKQEFEKANYWAKTGFSSKGLRAYLFKVMLHQLNQAMRKYGDRLGISIQFSVDMDKISKPFTTICSIGDKQNKDYRDFSGGQKQRLDIVLMFGMHDIISTQNYINILIMDEVFEGLDQEGETAVFDLIRDKAEDGKKAIHIISHSQSLDTLYGNNLYFSYDNGQLKTI